MRPMQTAVTALLALGPLPAVAQQGFALPAGCTGYVTVQMKSCTVSHHFTCTNDPEGLQRRVDLAEDGVTYFGAIDAETQWIESFHVRSGHSERLEDEPANRASFSALLADGVDTYDFSTLSDEIGPTRYVGQDSLTGETVEIDGVTLDRTQYTIMALDADGNEMWRSTGNEFISRDWRMFLSGTSTYVTPEDTYEVDNSPVEFVFPGEPGFLSANPKFGCGEIMSSLPQPHNAALPPEESPNDDI